MPTKVCIVKVVVFPIFQYSMYGCESWTRKKAECWRINAFKLQCWRRLLRVQGISSKETKPVNPKGNQSWTFIGRTDAEAKALILWPPDAKSRLIGKDPDAGKDWGQERRGNRGWGGWMASLTQWIWVWANSGRWWKTTIIPCNSWENSLVWTNNYTVTYLDTRLPDTKNQQIPSKYHMQLLFISLESHVIIVFWTLLTSFTIWTDQLCLQNIKNFFMQNI